MRYRNPLYPAAPLLQPRPKNIAPVHGISDRQLLQHYKLYEDLIDRLNWVWKQLRETDRTQVNDPAFSEYRSLKVEETRFWNAVKLHELYFDNLGQPSERPGRKLTHCLEQHFGSVELWQKDFISCCLCCRSWTALVVDPDAKRLFNIVMDDHHLGSLWRAQPLLVFDGELHAYYSDFNANRKDYLKAFVRNIHWQTVDKRLGALQ